VTDDIDQKGAAQRVADALRRHLGVKFADGLEVAARATRQPATAAA
jgi:hypothetical protein